MGQAILITAYKDFRHLIDIINYFPPEGFEFYIHIDKKSKEDINILKNIKSNNIKLVSKKYNVNWGGFNHLKCILFLASEALKNENIDYFHLISGQDFPIKGINYFQKGFNLEKDYLGFIEMPVPYLKFGAMDRLEYFNFYDLFNAKKYPRVLKILKQIQIKFNIKRSISNTLPTFYYGSTWWSLTRVTLQHVINYTNNSKDLFNRMRYTFCAEEMYFQTVILNSHSSSNVVNDNLRYIDWESGRGGSPAFIDDTDFSSIKDSNKLFARKFQSNKSNNLKLLLTDSRFI
jgi:hypothetical protein